MSTRLPPNLAFFLPLLPRAWAFDSSGVVQPGGLWHGDIWYRKVLAIQQSSDLISRHVQLLMVADAASCPDISGVEWLHAQVFL